MINVILGVILGIVAAVVLTAVLTAWPVMILIGVLHSLVPVVPALGFVPTFVICVIVALMTSDKSFSSND
jgi:predicted PurR-regulated permease PerM